MSNDTLRARIRLALGGDVIVGDRLPSRGATQRYAAVRGRDAALVTVFPRAPLGPSPEALRSMVDRFRAAQHAALIMPRQAIDIDGCACLVGYRPSEPTLLERLHDGATFSRTEIIVVLRSVARALATLHRRGFAHGAIELDNIHVTDSGPVVSGLGSVTDGTVEADLFALGRVAYALVTGAEPDEAVVSLAGHRRTLPPELRRLIDAMLNPDPARRPDRAEAVLKALDAIPLGEPRAVPSFRDGAPHGARVPQPTAVRVAIAVIAVLLVMALISTR